MPALNTSEVLRIAMKMPTHKVFEQPRQGQNELEVCGDTPVLSSLLANVV
jgi:hypothetical protein